MQETKGIFFQLSHCFFSHTPSASLSPNVHANSCLPIARVEIEKVYATQRLTLILYDQP